MPKNPYIRAEGISADELSDAQIERLMAPGKREAELIDEMEVAALAGDRELVWQLVQTLVRLQEK